MLKRLPMVCALLLGLATPTLAAPVLLANFTPAWVQNVQVGTNPNPNVPTSFTFDFGVSPFGCSSALLACGFSVPLGTTGVFDFDQSNAPNFAKVAAALTDNIDDGFAMGAVNGGMQGHFESIVFGGLLTGRQISSIRLKIRQATAQKTVLGGGLTSVSMVTFFEWEIWGTGTPLPIHPSVVPEPGTYAMALSGLAVLGFWRSRRQVERAKKR